MTRSPQHLQKIIAQVEALLECEVFLVGGAVRDHLLNREVSDFDFTTAATPDYIESMLRRKNCKPYLVGKRYGTVGFKLPYGSDFTYVEITTFREESYSPNSRQPVVNFAQDLQVDLLRRDFTINAIAIGSGGAIIDTTGGQEDIKRRTLRCVGDPCIKFKEDPLRLLRAVRFAGALEFTLEEATSQALQSCTEELLTISWQRITQEMDTIMHLQNPVKSLQLLRSTGLLTMIIPELSLLTQKRYNQNLSEIEHAPKDAVDRRWRLFLQHTEIPYTTKPSAPLRRALLLKICRQLQFSKARTKVIISFWQPVSITLHWHYATQI